jgi:transposase
MSHHIKGQGRNQVTFFPEALDDFVDAENPVRVIDVFVDRLNLSALGFDKVTPKHTGRPAYHPAALLKLYIYGYLNRIQSSRRLEKETHRNVELMWLLERLQPDFKTIADFRKDNAKGIKNSCRTFVELCRQMNMFNDTIIAIDGSKFKAVNSKRNNFNAAKVEDRIARIEKNITEYLEKLDDSDAQASSEKATLRIQDKLAWLEKRLIELQQIKEKVEAQPDKQVSLTDPDARLMRTDNLNRKVCYNVQSAVDTKHHLIVCHDITTSTDRGQLTPVATQVQEALHKKDITVIADKGYFSRLDIKAAQDLCVTSLVPQTDTSGSKKKGIFNKSLFKYDTSKDVYICPAGNELPHCILTSNPIT